MRPLVLHQNIWWSCVGPEPLESLFQFCVNTFQNARGTKLSSLQCHDIVCKIAEIVVVGGVRRSALISLSNLSDDRMRHAKSGQWWEQNVQKDLQIILRVIQRNQILVFSWTNGTIYDSKSGERGIFNRESANKMI